MEIIYTAWFVSWDELQDAIKDFAPCRLEKTIEFPHVTLAFRPRMVDTALFGTSAKISITGYGNNGKNEGVSVTVEPEGTALTAPLQALKQPHITLSVSAEGKAVNTVDLDFHPVPQRTICGTFGAFTADGTLLLTPETVT